MNPQQKPVKIINNIPAVVADGHGIGINPDNGTANLLFIQVELNQASNIEEAKRKAEEASEVNGNVVANVRLSVEQLEALRDAITQAIDDYNKTKTAKT